MGTVIALDEYIRRMGEQKRPSDISHESLMIAQREIFGNSRPSFLEIMLGESKPRTGVYLQTVDDAAHTPVTSDFLNSRYAEFGQYDLQDYQHFIGQAISYYQRFDGHNWRAIDRLLCTARHIFRYEEGLPKVSESADITSMTSTLMGRLSYYIKERRVENKLKKFKESVLFK